MRSTLSIATALCILGATIGVTAPQSALAAPPEAPSAAPADTASAGARPTTIDPCAVGELRVTLAGTDGDDRLVGTPGRDVIDPRGGNDVVDGLGGDDVVLASSGDDVLRGGRGQDVLLGGEGADTVLGGSGDDALCGGNGVDVLLGDAGDDRLLGGNEGDKLSGSFGTDVLDGGRGVDVVAGGPGADLLAGGLGNDSLGGGAGDDELSGGDGDDRLSGSPGTDALTGDRGQDSCVAAEEDALAACEDAHASGNLTASVTTAEGDLGAVAVSWSGAADRGVVLVEVYVDDAVAHVQLGDGGAPSSGTAQVPFDGFPGTSSRVFVVLTDGDGEQVASEAVDVEVPDGLKTQPAQTVLRLSSPTPIGELTALLEQADVTPIEYRAFDVDRQPLEVDPALASQVRADGFVPVAPEGVNVVYDPQATPVARQAAALEAYYARQQISGPAIIDEVSVEGPVTTSDLGVLADRVTDVHDSPRPAEAAGVEPSSVVPPAPSRARRDRQDQSSGPSKRKGAAGSPESTREPTGQTSVSALDSSGSDLMTAMAAPDPVTQWWPQYGRFDVDTYDYTETVRWCVDLWLTSPCYSSTEQHHRAELQHDLVFSPQVLAAFGDRSAAYEHDVTVSAPGRRSTRPFCNPFDGRADDFYVRSEGSFGMHSFPAEAHWYHDTAIELDGCDSDQVSFGLARPWTLADNTSDGQLAVYQVQMESERNDDADRSFQLSAQTLFVALGCDLAPVSWKHNCVGLRTDLTQTAPLARTGGASLSPTLPTCVVWKWLPVGTAADSPTRLSYCSADTDADGFDDAVDCAPLDPAIHPGAVDVPNDGIDQNCSGGDLVVGSGTLQVTLIWDDDNDMDLHVIEPGGSRIWYSQPGPSPTGGRLDRDDNVGVCGRDAEAGGVENVFWPQATQPARGTYRVEVVEYDRCADASSWVAEVRIDGELVTRRSGTGAGSFTFDR